jgi:hypothetical protein
LLDLKIYCVQGLYVEMKFEKPSRIQAMTLPMILTPPYKDLIAQVGWEGDVCQQVMRGMRLRSSEFAGV